MTPTKSITSTKISTLQNLSRQYNDVTTIAAKAESAYESYTNKAQLFQDLVTMATSELNTANAQWTSFLSLKSSLKALEQISDDSNLVAEVTYKNISQLVKKWERVVQKTLEAANAINLASDYICKRQAPAAALTNDIIADATAAKKSADATVTLVINALTATLNTLTASNQAKNSTELTGAYIDMASSALLRPISGEQVERIKTPHIPLEESLQQLLQKSTNRLSSRQLALNDINTQVAVAKEELDTANAKVVAAQRALSAAQATINA